MADSKKLSFSTTTNSQYFSPKFQGLVLVQVESIDAKGIESNNRGQIRYSDFVPPFLIIPLLKRDPRKTQEFFSALLNLKVQKKDIDYAAVGRKVVLFGLGVLLC